MVFLAPIQYRICGSCSWQAMKKLESEILGKNQARKKSPAQMKINFLNPSFSNLQCYQKIERGKCFAFGLGVFWMDDVPLTIGLHYQKILR